MKKFLCAIIAAFMCLSLAACGGRGDGGGNGGTTTLTPEEAGIKNLANGYTYSKQNNDGLMQFYSSDSSLDTFVNDYMERHLRYSDKAINSLKIGEGNSVWKEWDIMSVAWMNTSGIGYSPKDTVANWFSTIYRDDYGYVWFDNGNTVTDWGMNWEFPGYRQSFDAQSGKYLSSSYFNESEYKNSIDTAGNTVCEINSRLSDYWNGVAYVGDGSSTLNATKATVSTSSYGNLNSALVIDGKNINRIEYTYLAPEDGEERYKDFMSTPWCSPFLELDFSVTDSDSLGVTNQVEDVVVYWKGGSNADKAADGWKDTHSVSYKADAINYKAAFSSSTHIVFPMFSNKYWGTSKSIDDAITDMKIVVKFKNGINAEVRLEEVSFSMDARQVVNNCVYVAAGAYYFQYTQDTAWLAKNMDNLRSAMQFLLTTCKGGTQALATTEELVGHDGSSNYDYYGVNVADRKTEAVGSGIGDGYWDCINSPQVGLYVNINYYKALKGMEYLERMFKAATLTESGETVSVRKPTKNDSGEYVYENYSETSETLSAKISAFVTDFREYFWNDTTGRFLLGYLPTTDPGVVANARGCTDKVAGSLYGQNTTQRVKVDYGFTAFNEECVELGLATSEQAQSIMKWLNGERTVAGDTADNSEDYKQIYQYSFAPRFTTVNNLYQFWYRFNGTSTDGGKYAWNAQIQNGGAAVHCAYYDIVAENIANGADGAFGKLKKIQAWYDPIMEFDATGENFYRNYYKKNFKSVKLQGGTAGAGVIGLDCEFVEAEILVTAIPTAFFGLKSNDYKVLDIAPALPSSLTYWKMENLSYAGALYDLTIGKDWVQLNSVSGETDGLKVRVTLDKPEGDFTVRQHNKVLVKDTDYTVEGDKVVILAPFSNGRIQIVK